MSFLVGEQEFEQLLIFEKLSAAQFDGLIIIWSIIIQFCREKMESYQLKAGAHLYSSQSLCQASSLSVQPLFVYYFNPYCNWHIGLTQEHDQINNQNDIQIDQRVSPMIDPPETQKINVNHSYITVQALNKNTTQEQQCQNQDQNQEITLNSKKHKSSKGKSDNESYIPQEQFQNENTTSTLSQSKNIPKNYGKAISIFIRKNQVFVRRVLSHLNFSYRDFMKSFSLVKRKLKAISHLRGLWIQQGNPMAKAYRIISLQYLRKHSFPYIFNSRVANIHKHIKYRYKMIESVGSPNDFTMLKEF